MAPATQWATLNAELQLVKHKLSVQKHGHPRRTLLALMLPLQTAELQIKPPLHSLTLKLDRNLQLMLHAQLPPTLSAATNCRGSNKLSAAFADGKTGIKSATDASCTAVSNAQCRNATTGVVEAIGAQAWTSATSTVCKAVVAANCRDSGNLSIVFADKKTGQKSATDTSCTSASDTQCRNGTTGVLAALGTNKWTSADSAVCAAMTDATKCRKTKLTEVAYGEGSDARKSSTDYACHTLAATECQDDALK